MGENQWTRWVVQGFPASAESAGPATDQPFRVSVSNPRSHTIQERNPELNDAQTNLRLVWSDAEKASRV
jgi:hypothetical protein